MSDRETYASEYHVPIMVAEVLEQLDVVPGGRYVDATAGGGGHTAALLDASAPDGRVLAIDRDPEAIDEVRTRLDGAGGRLQTVRGNYGRLVELCAEYDFLDADGLLVDAGISSHQVDEAERGFSFRKEGPLDMRMGPEAVSLEDYLEAVDRRELTRVLETYGDVRGAYRIAGAILEEFGEGRIETTLDLADCVERVAPGWSSAGRRTGMHPATLVFQALRIAVNRELEHLERAVEAVPEVVASGGRAAFISFHSLEDRIVKHGLRDLANDCVCPPDLPVCGCDAVARVRVLTSSPIRASEEEVDKNPRARSAKLRAAEVL
ncbi:MAG: 16S rRNA (cytosine(1402)-N(4))-methyltransferase RsmH [Persicimonas sp.]